MLFIPSTLTLRDCETRKESEEGKEEMNKERKKEKCIPNEGDQVMHLRDERPAY